MSDVSGEAKPVVRLSGRTVHVLLIALALLAVLTASWFRTKYDAEHGTPLIDFDAFHIAGQMAWQGQLEEAYSFGLFRAHQKALSGGTSFMPWTYPPPFDLVAAALALLPVWLAYLAFVSITLTAFLLVLRRVAGDQFGAVFLCLLPNFVIVLICGQNGFLTGGIIGLFVLLALRGSRWAGLPLGLMVIKPHLALGVGFYLLITRRWGWIAQAAAVALGLGLLSTLAFGPGIWSAFLHGVQESGAFLRSGQYPLQRMTSVYAGLRAFGLDADAAFGGHAGLALCALAMVQVAVVRRWRTEQALAVAILATLMVSPYNYDYDLPILGLALGLVFRTASEPWLRRAAALAMVLAAAAGAYSLIVPLLLGAEVLKPWLAQENGRTFALSAFGYVALVAVTFAMLWRAEGAGRDQLAQPAWNPGR